MTYTPLSPIFFLPLVFIGAFFLLNLTLAVVMSKFSEEEKKTKEKKKPKGRKQKGLTDFDHLDED